MKNTKIEKMVGIGLFTAIVMVLQLLGGSIRVFGMFSISLVLVPVVVGAAVYGWQAGAWLGFVFGFAVLLSGDASSFMVVDPLATVLVVLVKGTACGLVSGLVYTAIKRFHSVLAVIASAVVCPIVNTGIFLLGCQLFFLDTIAEWATQFGFSNAGKYMIFGLAGTNFLVELAVNLLLGSMIVRVINYKKK